MTKIVSIVNHKGGVGKTTISTNLASALSLQGDKVRLVDSDPQGSARDWHAVGKGDILDVVGLDRPTLAKDIKSVCDGYDWVIVDGAAKLSEMSVAAIKCSDIVLIPVRPSPYDVWAIADLVDMIKERQSLTDGKFKAAFVISSQIANSNLGKEVRSVLDDYKLPVFVNGTFQRVIYPTTAGVGSSVVHTDRSSDASKEMFNIANELREFAK